MLFHSYQFLVFLVVVAGVHTVLPLRWRWLWLLAASYVFYAAWRAEYLLLIVASTTFDYAVALALDRADRPIRRRLLLAASLAANLTLLGTFKYFNFFADSFESLARRMGMEYLAPHLDVLLPVGISFYTFQSMSYTIDVYRRRVPAERHAGMFALFVAFFPQLTAGPIGRAKELLPQLKRTASFDYERTRSGLALLLWGFFKKIVIADRLAIVVNFVYANPERCPGPLLILGTVFFAFQIYCDFSGYTDIARGCARIFGVELMKNFDRPYFATSINDFWRRWHISLTTWFRDYLYIPLGGNRSGRRRWIVNIVVVFLISGLWHGANWTFVVWGLVHALVYLGERAIGWANAGDENRSRASQFAHVGVTFVVVSLAWVFFRSVSVEQALYTLEHMAYGWSAVIDPASLARWLGAMDVSGRWLVLSISLVVFLVAIEKVLGNREWETVVLARPQWQRWAIYVTLALAILNLGTTNELPFVYYQF